MAVSPNGHRHFAGTSTHRCHAAAAAGPRTAGVVIDKAITQSRST
jgi:hypothetical protein